MAALAAVLPDQSGSLDGWARRDARLGDLAAGRAAAGGRGSHDKGDREAGEVMSNGSHELGVDGTTGLVPG